MAWHHWKHKSLVNAAGRTAWHRQAEYNRHWFDASQAMFQNKCMMYKVPTRTQLQTSKTVYNKITNMWAWLWSRFMQKCISIMVYSTCEIKNKTFPRYRCACTKQKWSITTFNVCAGWYRNITHESFIMCKHQRQEQTYLSLKGNNFPIHCFQHLVTLTGRGRCWWSGSHSH